MQNNSTNRATFHKNLADFYQLTIRTHLERIKMERVGINKKSMSIKRAGAKNLFAFRLSKCIFHLCCKCKLIIGLKEFEFLFLFWVELSFALLFLSECELTINVLGVL